jgi:response regulator of citrate/malate metabolism
MSSKKTSVEIIDAIMKELEKASGLRSSGDIATAIGSNSTTVSKYLEMIEHVQGLKRIEIARTSKIVFGRLKGSEK